MVSTSGKAGPETTADAATSDPQDIAMGLWNSLSKHQTQRILQTLVALLRHSEEMGMAHFNAAHVALDRHRQLLQRLQQVHTPGQLAALQAELWRLDSAGVARWSRAMFDAAWQLQTDMLQYEAQTLAASQFEAASKAFQAFGSSLHNGLPPFDDLLLAPLAMASQTPSDTRH